MTTLARRLLLTACLLAAPALYAQPRPGGQVLHADEIAQAGVTRLTDLFDLLDGWFATSVDGFTWDASAGGLAPPGGRPWSLFVDGQPVDLVAFGRTHLNALPVHVSQLDSVVAVAAPDVRAGTFAPAGALHLYTRRPAHELSVRGSVAASNEVNDPGPFRYTPHASPNIDRSGPTFLAEAAARAGGLHARLSAVFDEFHATDERIRERVLYRYRGRHSPRLLLAAPGLDLGLERPGSRHRLTAGYAQFDDLLFWAPVGGEVPATHLIAFVGLDGSVAPDAPHGLAYRARLTRYDLAPRPSRDTLDLDFAQDRLDVDAETRLGAGRVRGALGAGARYYLTRTAAPVRDPSLLVSHAYAHLVAEPWRWWRQELAVHVSHTYDRIGVQALAHGLVRPAAGHAVSLRLAVSRETVEEQNGIWYWTAAGYDLPARTGLDFAGLPYLPLSTTATADLAWEGVLSPALSVRAGVAVRRFFEHFFADYRFAFDSTTHGLAARTRLTPGVDGRVAGASAGVRFTGVPRVDQRLHYAYTRPVWSSPVFWSAWGPQPWHQASYTVLYAPVPRFSLYARLRYRSASAWPAFAQASAETGGRIPERLPAFWLLDVTARKLFWRDHVAASLTLRNLLNEPFQTHPAGAVTDLSFGFRIELYAGAGPRLDGRPPRP